MSAPTKSPTQSMFYQPNFGNDNFYGVDVVDIAAFTMPASKRKDPAAAAPVKKVSEKI